MPPASRLLGLAGMYTAIGWVMHCLMRSDQSGLSLAEVVLSREPLKTALVAGIVGVLMTPVALKLAGATGRPRLRRWLAGVPFGAACALAIVYLRFLAWPAAWQGSRGEAWKTTVTVFGVYWMLLAPAAILGGVAVLTLASPKPRSDATPSG
jgi:hypothetical protein